MVRAPHRSYYKTTMVNSRTVMELMVSLIANHEVELTQDEFETIREQMTYIFEQSPQVILNTIMNLIDNHSIDIDEDEMFSILCIIQTLRRF